MSKFIRVKKDGKEFVFNSDQVVKIENTEDGCDITLSTQEVIAVNETLHEVLEALDANDPQRQTLSVRR